MKKKTEGITIVSAEPEAGFITMSAIVKASIKDLLYMYMNKV